jgi:hypothetical protein
MENHEIIKLAVRLTEENNSVYKIAAINQAFMIKAKDKLGTIDTFITVRGIETADQWQSAFTTAGFSDVIVSPFRGRGNLSIKDVNSDLFDAVSERAKWRFETKPEGYNTPFTSYNPYAGKDTEFDSSDPRLSKTVSVDDTNEYQKYLFKNYFKEEKDRIFSGWFDGSLVDWLSKIASIDTDVNDILSKTTFAYLYSSPKIIQFMYDMSVHNPEFDPKTFEPSKVQIKNLIIKMYPLINILVASSVDADEFPENLIYPQLDMIVQKARNHKFFKQYEQEDLNAMQQSEINEQFEKDKATYQKIKRFLRGLSA